MNPRRRLSGDALLLGGGAAAGQALATLAAPLLTRCYGAEAFGVFGLFSSLLSCAGVAASLRLDQAILLERETEAAETLLRLTLLATLAVAGGLGAGLALLRLVAPASPWAAWALVVGAPPAVLCAGVFAALSAWFTRQGRFRPLAAYQMTRSGATVLLQLGLSLGGRGGALLVGGQVLGLALATLRLAAADRAGLRRALTGGWRPGPLLEALRRHAGFVLHGAPQSLLRVLATNLPLLMLPVLLPSSVGAAEAGRFWLAWRMLILPSQILVESLRGPLFRHAAGLDPAGDARLRFLLRHCALVAALCAPALPVLLLAGPVLFGWVFGPAWRGAGDYAALIVIPWWLEAAQMPAAVLIAVLRRQSFALKLEVVSLAARALALAIGCRLGGASLAVGLYAAVWGASSLVTLAAVALFGRARPGTPHIGTPHPDAAPPRPLLITSS